MSSQAKPTPEQWLGLLLVTESARANEWEPIAWVVRNRVASPRFPHTVEEVVLQPRQFSRFNDWAESLAEGGPAAVWDAAQAWLAGRPADLALLPDATALAAKVLAAPASAAPFGPRVLHYYSPRSMAPPHSVPRWWWREIEREVPLLRIDPNRFRFGESKERARG